MAKYAAGDAVEVKREVSYKPWEPATYVKAHTDWRGWHLVELPVLRYINRSNGEECEREHPNAVGTRRLSVPSRRLRARASVSAAKTPEHGR